MALTKSQYDEIIRGYSRRQASSRRELTVRTEALYRRFPRLCEIQSLISSLSVSTAKSLLLEDKKDSMNAYRKELHALSAEKEQILASAGYPKDYLSPVYECMECKDTGYLPTGEKCRCFLRQELDILYSQSNIRDIVSRENFDVFSYRFYSDDDMDAATGKSARANIKNVVSICKKFIKNFSDSPDNLFFYGETGVGKTFLCNCIARDLMEQFYSVIYLSAVQLFDLLAGDAFSRENHPQAGTRHMDKLLECELLIIDDLGTELSNAFTSSALFQCLNERILRRHSTIISSNLSFENIQSRYSDRLFSRILGNYKILKIHGKDIRLQKYN